jgi:EmrB/QacA subfamily drug resistance transporter
VVGAEPAVVPAGDERIVMTTVPSPPLPSLVPLRSGRGIAVIAATVLASMAGFLDANVVNVAVPAIGRDLGASLVGLQWSLTGYLLTAAALLLVAGALADAYGRRRVLVAGLLVMLVASVACAVAPSFPVLIAARVVQGAGAALVVPSSLALLNGTLRPRDRAAGIGVWAGLASLGTLVGPFVGGWLVDHASWRAVFLLNVPLILAALLALLPVPESAATRGPLSLDATGAVLAVVGLAGLIDGLTTGTTKGWMSPRVVAGLVIGAACLIALVPAERRIRAPMLKLSLFKSRQFSAINVATVVFYGALAAASYLLVLRCELTLGYTAAEAGAVLIPSSVVFLALSPVSGALAPRIGARLLMTAGIAIVAVAFLWLGFAGPAASYAQAILPGVLLWGLGLGLTVTPLTAAVLAAVGDADLGEASAISDVAARLGGAVMIALVPALIGVQAGRGLAEALMHGYRPAMTVLTVLCVVAAVISAVFVRDTRTAPPRFAPPAPYHGCALPDPGPGTAPHTLTTTTGHPGKTS